MTVLVIDDQIAVGKSIQMALMSDRVNVSNALDGATGLKQARENPPDLILLDIGMPGMSGFEVCQELKRDPSLQAVPVVFISGWGDQDNRKKAMEAGGAYFLLKPFKMETLREIIRRFGPGNQSPLKGVDPVRDFGYEEA